MPVLVLGTTQFSEEVADLIEETPNLFLAGFVENLNPERCNEKLLGHPVYWVNDLATVAADSHLVCGIGTTKRKLYVDQVRSFGLPFATVQHPTARVSSRSRIGEGSVLGVNSIVAAHSNIGNHVIINRAATVGHHTEIGDYVTISPGANIAGRCTIGSGTYVGMGAIIIDGLRIGSNSIVGAGAVVTRDVPDNVQVVGIPAKAVKEGVHGR